MTGWGVFWNVYRRGTMATQAQVQSKRTMKQQAVAKAPQQTAATRSIATATTANTTKGKEDDANAWANDWWDDASDVYEFLILR
jgi:hypothetical protein